MLEGLHVQPMSEMRDPVCMKLMTTSTTKEPKGQKACSGNTLTSDIIGALNLATNQQVLQAHSGKSCDAALQAVKKLLGNADTCLAR